MPERRLRIAIADHESGMRQSLQALLTPLGHEVVVAAATGRELVEQCRTLRPDLVLTDVQLPEMDGIEAAETYDREVPTPAVLLAAHYDEETLRRAGGDHIMACLVKPVTAEELRAAIRVATSRFEAFQAARREAQDLRQALEERKLLEQAKGIVMRRLGVEEAEAHRLLHKLGGDKLMDVVRRVLHADEVFQALERAAR